MVRLFSPSPPSFALILSLTKPPLPFGHVLPRPSQLSGRDRASAKNLSPGQALPEGIQGLWETQGGGRAIRWGKRGGWGMCYTLDS